jgi:hypothetical protein
MLFFINHFSYNVLKPFLKQVLNYCNLQVIIVEYYGLIFISTEEFEHFRYQQYQFLGRHILLILFVKLVKSGQGSRIKHKK